jgi:hypothetical protein
MIMIGLLAPLLAAAPAPSSPSSFHPRQDAARLSLSLLHRPSSSAHATRKCSLSVGVVIRWPKQRAVLSLPCHLHSVCRASATIWYHSLSVCVLWRLAASRGREVGPRVCGVVVTPLVYPSPSPGLALGDFALNVRARYALGGAGS